MNYILRYLLFSICFLVISQAPAQSLNCVDFTSPEVGTIFNTDTGVSPGDVVYQYPGSDLIMEEFINLNGGVDFGNLGINDFGGDELEAPSMIINYANATFQFDGPVNALCFVGSISGLEINLGINGETIVAENLLDPTIQETWPDYEITVDPTGTTPGNFVSVCIFGPLESFTIGGIEQLVDDVCIDYFPACEFTNPVVEAFCQDSGATNIYIDFEEVIGNNNFVDVFVDGESYGFYSIEAFPITLENVFPNGTPNITNVQVCINDNPDCCYDTTITLPECSTESCITFEDMGADTVFSSPDVVPGQVVYQFPGVNMIMDTYISINGNLRFEDLFVLEGQQSSPLTGPYLYSVFANATFAYANPVTDVCFLVSNNEEQINLGINGQIEPFASLQDPGLLTSFPNHEIVVTAFQPGLNLYQICLTGTIESFTIGGAGLIIDDVCSSTNLCDLSNLQVAQYACEDDNEPYLFYLNFEHHQLTTDSFDLRVNGDVFARYAYGDLPLSELDFGVTAGMGLDILVLDVENEDCAADLNIDVHNCDFACTDFVATAGELTCVEPFAFSAQLLLSTPPTGQFIRLFSITTGEQVELSTYDSWDGVFFIIDNEPDPLGYLVVDDLTGCETIFPGWDFNPEQCQECDLFNVSVIPSECNPNGVYSIVVDLEPSNPFYPLYVTVDNEQFGPFEPNEFPLTLSPFIGQTNEVTVTIQSSNENCFYTTEFIQDCNESCSDFTADLTDVICTDNSPYVTLEIFLTGVSANSSDLYLQNQNTGALLNVEYTGNPLIVDWPTADDGVILIVDQITGCETSFVYENLQDCEADCSEVFNVLEVGCNEDGNPVFVFTANGPEGLPFVVRVGGPGSPEYPFVYGQDIYELTVDAVPNVFTYELRFHDQLAGCVSEVLVDNPCFCFINIESAEVTECNGDGQFFILLNISAGTSWGNGTFIVEAGNYVETIPEGLSILEMGPFESGTVSVFVTEATTGSCDTDEVLFQECPPVNCELGGLVIEGTTCDADGNYFINITFDSNVNGPFSVYNTATTDSVSVTLDELPLQFGPYNINEIQTSQIVVHGVDENNLPTCIIDGMFIQECEPLDECNFNDIFAEPYACDGDQFMVDVAFNNPNGGPLGFYIFGDGMLFGPFQYGETFYTFGPLDGSESSHDILLLDIANPACFGTYDFNYSCSDDCTILEVIATPTECDGEFFNVELDVSGNNLGETFTVVGNGNNYGVFNYNDLPITLGPFVGDAETSYEFGVIDLQNPGCTNFTEIAPVNCQPCDIRDLVYEVDCNENGYILTLDFIFENQESDLFAVLIGGEVYEFFSYDNLPLSIPVPYDFVGNTLRVEDVLDELCGETVGLEIPCCTLGNALNELEVAECEDNGEYYFVVGNFTGGNLSDSLIVNYAPAGSTIIATEVVAYNNLPVEIGPLSGDGLTSYIVILSDQENECAVTTTIEPIFCDNDACVEFEGVEGVFAPIFGYDTGDEITTENEVLITYQRNPLTNCACNLFVTDGIPGIDFGSGQIVATQNSGFGLDFTALSTPFNTVNIDYYYTGGTIGIIINGGMAVTSSNINDLPTNIAPGVELQLIPDPGNPTIGMLTFSGDNLAEIIIFTEGNAGFDNVCTSLDDNVWPGDTNSDNIANNVDLLSIGLTFGNTGPARPTPTSEWTGLISQDWGDDFADGTNHKHADANGDGLVDLLDLEVLEQNYNLEHGPVTDFEPLPYTDLDPPVFVDLPDQLPVGTVVEIPIVAGGADQIIEDVYGLAFTIELDPEIFTMSSLAIVYPTSWFGEPGINTATIHEIYADGRVEVALTRTDHNNVSGFGTIMSLRIIIDDIAGIEVPTEVVVKNLLGIDHDEQPLILRPGTSNTMVTKTTDGAFDRNLLLESFGIFPNPTSDWVHFQNQYSMAPQRVDIFNTAGQHLRSTKNPGMHLDVSALPAGVYMIQVHLEGHIFTEKLVKLD